MIVFGLTGGIASGKSTVTKTLRAHGIPMVDADVIAREVVEPGTHGLKLLTQTFGKEYFLSDGTLNRVALGRLVFSDASALKQLNAIMSPLIYSESGWQIAQLLIKGHDIVGYDAALLIETGNYKGYNCTILVACPPEIQINRLMRRNGLTREEAQARLNAQLPLEEKLKCADFVIDTSGTVEESIAQTNKAIQFLEDRLVKQKLERGET